MIFHITFDVQIFCSRGIVFIDLVSEILTFYFAYEFSINGNYEVFDQLLSVLSAVMQFGCHTYSFYLYPVYINNC